jgi:hypothetical protein
LVVCLPLTFWRLAMVAIFTTELDAENQTLITHKCVCGALNRSRQQRDAQCLFSFDYDFVYFLHNSICFYHNYLIANNINQEI